MPSLSAPGIGSNLDVNGLVGQLMAVERRPLALLDRKEASFQAKLSALGSVKSALAAFQTAMAGVAQPARFNGSRASVADASLVAATASPNSAAGSYSVEVQTLAQAHKLKSAAFGAPTDTLGSGTLTIQFGTYSGGTFTVNADRPTQTVAIPAGAASLAGVRDAINAAGAGVTASIVNDGTGERLVLGSAHSGLANALRITVADDDGNDADAAGLSRLAYDASAGGTANLAQTVAAQNATAVIDGIVVSKASNTITDAIAGVTLTLAKASPGTTTTLTVARDTAAARAAVEGFVDAYNDLAKALKDVAGYDAARKAGGPLQGDATVLGVQAQIRGVLNTALAGGSGLATLSDAGVSFTKEGTLALDGAKLDRVLADPAKDLATLFAAAGKPTDSLVSFVSAASTATPGRYEVDLTRLATRGAAVGGAAAALTIAAGVNDTLALAVDGATATVALTAGTYTAASLAAEIQSKVNGALSGSGAAVTVTASAGVLTVTSNRYGSASTVSLTGGDGLASLFGTPTADAGVDIAGSVGGVVGAGDGRTLAAAGLAVSVAGGATGPRGAVNYAVGFAEQLDRLAEALLASDGALAARTQGLDKAIKDVGLQRDAAGRRLEDVEKRYRAQFAALDRMLASMQSTSSFLATQLANVPKADR